MATSISTTTPTIDAQRRAAALLNTLVLRGHGDKVVKQMEKRASLAGARDVSGWTPLHIAVVQGDVDLTQRLAELGRQWLFVGGIETPLASAVRWGETDARAEQLSRVLLEAGAPPSVADGKGITPLHIAAGAARVQTATVLLNAGAMVHARAVGGGSVLHYAAIGGTGEITAPGVGDADKANAAVTAVIALLLERGAALDARDDVGEVALHWAARQGATAAIKALVNAGIDVTACNDDGETAYEIAAGVHKATTGAEQQRAGQCMTMLQAALGDAAKKVFGPTTFSFV